MSRTSRYDLCVYATTPAGCMAAIAARRRGMEVLLLSTHKHVGGMSASGLGKTDVRDPSILCGLSAEFFRRVEDHYRLLYGQESLEWRQCQGGLYYEPHVAEQIFLTLLRECEVEVWYQQQLLAVEHDSAGIAGIWLQQGTEKSYIQAKVYIDASYEGDLLAQAGASFRYGREGRDEWNEPHAGKIFMDYESFELLPGSTQQGDELLQAYTYRLCLTEDRDNIRPLPRPSHYQREVYLPYLEDLRAGRLGPPKNYLEGVGYYTPHFNTVMRAFSFAEIPGKKFDVNINPRPLAFPFVGKNQHYLFASPTQRRAIEEELRQLTLGLLFFAQNDPAVSAEQRELACQYGFPFDEFQDNEGFPWQLYVREGRRLEGVVTLTEHHVADTGQAGTPFPEHELAGLTVAQGEFPVDSFPVSSERRGRVLEGYLGMLPRKRENYPVPYGAMLPRSLEKLLVPVAVSATHVAFSTIRMEPLWMRLGEAAGQAAALAAVTGKSPREIPREQLAQCLSGSE